MKLLLYLVFLQSSLVSMSQGMNGRRTRVYDSSFFKVTIDNLPVKVLKCNTYSFTYSYKDDVGKIRVQLNENIESVDISPKSFQKYIKYFSNTVEINANKISPSSLLYIVLKINKNENLVILIDCPNTNSYLRQNKIIYNVRNSPYNIRVADSLTTEKLQQAIDDASQRGGGTIYIPTGLYEVTSLSLKDNVTIYLEDGAIIRGSASETKYPLDKKNNKRIIGPLLRLNGADNIQIRGQGVLDANGEAIANNDPLGPNRKYWRSVIRGNLLNSSKNVLIEGVICLGATEWTIRTDGCSNVLIRNVKVLNNPDWLWNDGIDIVNSDSVIVDKCFIYTGDDGFCVKTVKGSIKQSSNIIFKDCVIYSSSSGLRVGPEIFADIQNVKFTNIYIIYASRGIMIDNLSERGNIKDVLFDNVTLERFGTIRKSNDSKRYYSSQLVKIYLPCNSSYSVNNITLKGIYFPNVSPELFSIEECCMKKDCNLVKFFGVKLGERLLLENEINRFINQSLVKGKE